MSSDVLADLLGPLLVGHGTHLAQLHRPDVAHFSDEPGGTRRFEFGLLSAELNQAPGEVGDPVSVVREPMEGVTLLVPLEENVNDGLRRIVWDIDMTPVPLMGEPARNFVGPANSRVVEVLSEYKSESELIRVALLGEARPAAVHSHL